MPPSKCSLTFSPLQTQRHRWFGLFFALLFGGLLLSSPTKRGEQTAFATSNNSVKRRSAPRTSFGATQRHRQKRIATSRRTRRAVAQSKRRKVLLIGIDGCKPEALIAARTPHLDRLWRGGAYSFGAQTGDITLSGPGWSSMLTGVWRQKHGVIDNGFYGRRFGRYPHFFKRIKQAKPRLRTVSLAHWPQIAHYLVSDADLNHTYTKDLAVIQAAQRELRSKDPDVLFVHLDQVDHAGHSTGFGKHNSIYIKAIERVDALLGKLSAAMRQRPTYKNEDWLIAVSTDHGGSGNGHGHNIPAHRTIFVILHGNKLPRGRLLTPVTIVDIVPTLLTHLQIPLRAAWGLDGRSLIKRK